MSSGLTETCYQHYETLGGKCLYQEHAESFSHDAVEEVEGRVSRHHEEVREEEVFSAAVVQQGVVLTAKQRLIGILQQRKRLNITFCAVTSDEFDASKFIEYITSCHKVSVLIISCTQSEHVHTHYDMKVLIQVRLVTNICQNCSGLSSIRFVSEVVC